MEMGGNFCQILELGGTTIKGRRVPPLLSAARASPPLPYPYLKQHAYFYKKLASAMSTYGSYISELKFFMSFSGLFSSFI